LFNARLLRRRGCSNDNRSWRKHRIIVHLLGGIVQFAIKLLECVATDRHQIFDFGIHVERIVLEDLLLSSRRGAGRQRNNLRLNQRCLAQTFQALQPTQLAQAQIAQAQLAANAERSSARDPSTRQCAQQTPCDFKAHVLLNPSFCEVQTRRAGARFASFLSVSFALSVGT